MVYLWHGEDCYGCRHTPISNICRWRAWRWDIALVPWQGWGLLRNESTQHKLRLVKTVTGDCKHFRWWLPLSLCYTFLSMFSILFTLASPVWLPCYLILLRAHAKPERQPPSHTSHNKPDSGNGGASSWEEILCNQFFIYRYVVSEDLLLNVIYNYH